MAAIKLVRALAALAAIALLELGIPTALLAVGVLPSWAQLTGALTGPDNGTLFLGALTLLGWGAWAALTLSFTVEATAVLRHRSAPRLPVLGVTQHLAASLVAAIVVLLPSTGALASAAPATAATLHLPHATRATPERAAAGAAKAAATRTPAGQAGQSHTVASSDETLWGIAEHYLGDGLRWREVAALNNGVPQADGQSLTAHTVHLVPGWTLRLPTGADSRHPLKRDGDSSRAVTDRDDHADGASTHGRGERVHIVHPGETLSQIAETDLGNADDYPAIYAASTHTVQPDGEHLTDPDLILPGWHLTIPQPSIPTADPTSTPGGPGTVHVGGGHSPAPTAPSDNPTAAPTTTPSPSPTAAPETGPVGVPATSATPAPSQVLTSPAAGASGAPTATPSTAGTTPSTSASATTAAAPASAEDSPAASELRIGAAIAALLASGLMGGYAIKRALQQRNRRPGQTIAVPAQTSSLEQILASQADPANAELLDIALRTMTTHLPHGEPLPQVEAARIERNRIQLRADGAPVPPFTHGADGWWNLDPTAELLHSAAAADVAAPYPMLATLGKEPDGTLLLLNLAAIRTLLLDGTAQQVREVARALALDAATSPWGQELQILSAGLIEADLPQMMATGRIRRLDQIADAVTDLADLLLTAHQDPDASMPWMLVASDDVDEEAAWELAGLVSRAPHAPVALALPTKSLGPLFPEALRIDCATDRPQQLPHTAAPVVLQRVTETEYQILTEDLHTTEQPAIPATGAWTHVADDTRELVQPMAQQVATEEESAAEAPATASAHSGDVAGGAVTPFLAFAGSHTDSAARATSVPVLPLAPVASDPATPAASLAADGTEESTALPVDVPPRMAPITEPADLHAPEIRILGSVDVTGLGSSGRGKRLAEVAAYLYLRPGRTRADLAEAMSPRTPWTENSVKQRLHDLRNLLENTPDGTPRLARNARDGILPTMTGVRCDWARFQKLAERGLLAGPAGIDDLEAALALVRGRPFAGSTAAWSMPDAQEMVSRIVDTAHTIARYRTTTGHHQQARAAIAKGIDIHPSAELLYRDWIALEAIDGSRADVQRVISRLQEELRALDVEMEHSTQTLIEAVYERDLKGSA
ncbi:BTAD domain-containing putative transcriptional regulator [Streptacidiphilus rugosus]|uniref:BTAD domain-containing putative transcriptional regulator n=1 Tax=Streptacidiphilus rugosus TaxID=405783 RepID=UPI00055E61CD|nr:BTAD domain-containing putative transcriptional regulator [Streptacidiphilus rugosus]